jgi:hypothetical protein
LIYWEGIAGMDAGGVVVLKKSTHRNLISSNL